MGVSTTERRLELHKNLCSILDCPDRGDECRAYFQPPADVEMEYDCIVYERKLIKPTFANNQPYLLHDCYQVTLIYRNPDSDLPKKVALLPMCAHERHFIADNLHHDVFTLYH